MLVVPVKELPCPDSSATRREMRACSCASGTDSCAVTGTGRSWEEAGEALEVQRQVAFMREPDGVRDGARDQCVVRRRSLARSIRRPMTY